MDEDPLIGRVVAGVRITGRLGQGAMAVVYRGQHLRLERPVALKVLAVRGERHAAARERFVREGKAAAKVRHDNVVQVLDAGEQDGVTFLVMELVEGLSLGAILDQQTSLPPATVAHFGAALATGLAAIHAHHIIHRDIKPDNILIGPDKIPKITDLGLAKQLDSPEQGSLTATGVVVGTPLYVSPEAIRDPRTITPAADVYGLGATLYHALTGQPPFNGGTPFEVMRGHLDLDPKPVRELAPLVPIALAALVDDCLAKDPRHRPSSLELADRLTHSLDPPARTPLALALVAVLIAAGVAVWWLLQRWSHH